jgi:predicted dehydrogenase
MSAKDGMNYVAESSVKDVACKPGELVMASVALDHGHIYGMTQGMIEAGATLKWVYDPSPARVKTFLDKFPQAKVARTLDEVLEDPEVKLVNAAAIPCDRAPLGIKVMRAGKDYFTDKTPFTTISQVNEARQVAKETGRKYIVNYSERIHNEAAVLAEKIIKDGAIGKVVGMQGFGPHRHGPAGSRPDWFYKKAQYGGILCDIGSHHCDQFRQRSL